MSKTTQPTVVMMAGLPGTGKSTLAQLVGQQLAWPVLDKDLVNEVLLQADLPRQQAAELAYDIVWKLVEDLVARQRRSVIVDTAGRQPFILKRLQQIAQATPARLKVVRCVAPAALRVERLANRTPLLSQWTTDQAADIDQDNWYAHLPANTLTVVTEQEPAVLVPKIITYLT